MAPLLFAILVNLSCDWINRLKYVNDTTVIELIPRNSPSYLPIAASDVNHYASVRNMRLNAKKCKEMTVDFLQYKPAVLSPLHVGGSLIERVPSHKLLGVIITNNLSWDEHCDYIYSKVNKRLFGLRVLKKSGLRPADLVKVYCSIIRSVLEYTSPVWAGLPVYLSDLLESIQRKSTENYIPARSLPRSTPTCQPGFTFIT